MTFQEIFSPQEAPFLKSGLGEEAGRRKEGVGKAVEEGEGWEGGGGKEGVGKAEGGRRGLGRRRGDGKRPQNSECFIVEGLLTHYKWYDYKHAHTTDTKQLTNNTKQTDKTKRSRKKKSNKHEQKEKKRKRQEQKTAPHPPPPTCGVFPGLDRLSK